MFLIGLKLPSGIVMNLMKSDMLKCFFAFAGYDSQALALKNLGIDYECIGWSEIDKYAIKAHNALFPDDKNKNYGDIKYIEWSSVPDFDFFTYSFPCTDISKAGKQKGLKRGTKTSSSLSWECERAIMFKKPKILFMENVKDLVSEKFLPYFLEWDLWLRRQGYTNYTKIINSKDFGIPQSRERVFMISILGESWFNFPDEIRLVKTVQDFLEQDIPEKYFLSEKMIRYALSCDNNSKNFRGNFERDLDRPICYSILASGYKMKKMTVENYYRKDGRIRRMTPREKFRLMGLKDPQIDIIQSARISDSQQYKLAGNSIVINVLEAIFNNLFRIWNPM